MMVLCGQEISFMKTHSHIIIVIHLIPYQKNHMKMGFIILIHTKNLNYTRWQLECLDYNTLHVCGQFFYFF